MTLKRIYKYLLVGLIGAIALPGLNDLGAAIEARFFPVLKNQVTYGGYWRYAVTGREFCWRWAFLKARPGTPDDFTAIVVLLPDGRRALLPAYRGDEDRPIEPAKAIGPDRTSDVELCSVMPKWTNEKTPFDIVGDVEYQRPHGLWQIKHVIPTLEWRPK